MKATDAIKANAVIIRDTAGHLGGGDVATQFHILIQAVAEFAIEYKHPVALLQVAIDSLTSVRDAIAPIVSEGNPPS